MKTDFSDRLLREIHKITGLEGELLSTLAGTVYATAFIGKMPNHKDTAAYLGLSDKTAIRLLKQAVEKAIGGVLPGEEGPLTKWYGEYYDFKVASPSVLEVVYSLATDIISEGIYTETGEEPFARNVARIYLGGMVTPQSVQTVDEFMGYNATLEYLWHAILGSGDDIDYFTKVRYEPAYNIASKLQSFADLVHSQNPYLADEEGVSWSYQDICEYLVDSLEFE